MMNSSRRRGENAPYAQKLPTTKDKHSRSTTTTKRVKFAAFSVAIATIASSDATGTVNS